MKSSRIAWISASDPPEAFPPPEDAFDVPEGLLAAGGNLSEERLLYAYQHGIFPWYNECEPILWWSPDPRCVLRPDAFRVSRRLARALRNSRFTISFNRAFAEVVGACTEPRPGQPGTWITPEMQGAYGLLHRQGWAHSIEVWRDDELAGGLYGLAIDTVFFGESMFSRHSNGSKAAMLALCQVLRNQGFALMDCQVESPHLMTLGAELMPRSHFIEVLKASANRRVPFAAWPAGTRPIGEFMTR